MSNTDDKEKLVDDGPENSPAKLLKKELMPETTPLMDELHSKEASPFLSALSPKPEQTAPPRPVKTYPMPQRKTVFFGESEITALDEEFQSINAPTPSPPKIQRVAAVARSSVPLPTPTPEALNAQAGLPEHISLSKNTSVTSSGVLGVPSENLLSTEDHGEVADPSATLSALLDEVFSEELPSFVDDIFLAQKAAALVQAPLAANASAESLPQAPPWDPIAAQVSRQTQVQFPAVARSEEIVELPSSGFVIPGARTPAPEPSVSLFEGLSETRIDVHLATTQEVAAELSLPAEALPDASEIQSAQAKLPLEMPAPVKYESPLISLAEQETAASILAAEPIFHLSSPPSFVDTESPPAPAAAPVFHPLEKTHEAVPAPLPWLLGAFLVDAVLLCAASFGILWAAKALTAQGPSSAQASSWLGNVAAWQVLGPTGLALLALLAAAYATFFAVVWNGSTPGRKLLGLRLVNKEGYSIGFVRALFRSLFSLLSFGLALSGFWWAIIDKRRQTFHDKCTGTFVVQIQPKQ